jgi:hypothetical protein
MQMKVGTNLFGKDQRVIKDSYRDAYDKMDWTKRDRRLKEKKVGNKIVITFKK